MVDIYLPTLHSFAMNNIFTGSWGAFRFRAEPKVIMATAKEVDFEQSSIRAEFWHGPFCYALSTMEAERTFPMTQEGLAELKQWLESNV